MAIGTKRLEDFVPIVKYNEGIYTELDITTTGSLNVTGDLVVDDITMDALTVTGNTALGNAATDTVGITGITTLTSANASALAVGRLGATTPAFVVDASTASSVTGVKVTSAAAAAGVAVAVVSSGTNENLTVDAKGSGTITFNATGTGNVASARKLNVMSATATPAGGTAGAGIQFGTTSNFGIFYGSGAPTLAAAQGSLYLRSDGSSTSTRAYINTDAGTTWTAITTAA